MRICLAVCLYEASDFYPTIIASITGQTLKADEILIVDDGSSQSLAPLLEQIPLARCITHEQNQGIGAARNSALQHCTADILVFLDADALASPDYLEQIIKPFSDEQVAGVNGQGVEVIQESIYDWFRKAVLFQHWGATDRDSVPFLFGMTAAYRTAALLEVGGFDQRFQVSGEDMDVSYRLRTRGYRLVYRSGVTVKHQRRDTAKSIEKMVYRHCCWGFAAQRKNRCYENKLSLAASGLVFITQLLRGVRTAQPGYSLLVVKLHLVIIRAWFSSAAVANQLENNHQGEVVSPHNVWEGHQKNAD
ncbi:MAG: glycosyltransferase family 2 protein [Desulfobulbaceae bacterium]|nr:MAG: glycosyltransferase family 2 protein [Desulfobulbaceae bacterium]